MQTNDSNLIVNYLPPTLTDGDFKVLFESVGSVASSRIIRDKTTGLSYGYGFVSYVNPDHSMLAISALDGHQLQNKRLKVSLARQGNDVRASNLYIANLPKYLGETELQDMFAGFGSIIQTKVLTDPNTGLSRGVGFIRYSTREEAQSAMDNMNGSKPPGFATPMLVKFAEDNREKAKKIQQAILTGTLDPIALVCGGTEAIRSSMSAISKNPMGMGNAGFNGPPGPMGMGGCGMGVSQLGMGYQSDVGGGPMRGPQMRQRFDPMGFNPAAQMGMGMGMNQMGPVNGGGANAGYTETTGFPLFVYNLGKDIDERSIYMLFAPFGAIQKVTVVRDSEGNSKGYAFVTMVHMHEAQNTIKNLNGSMYKEKRLQVSLKQPKGNKQAQMPSQDASDAVFGSMYGGGNNMGMNNMGMNNMNGMGMNSMTGMGMNNMGMKNMGMNSMGMNSMGMNSLGGSNGANASGGQEGGKDGGGSVIFVYNIGPQADERSLWMLFSPFGAVNKVSVTRTADSVCKGYGFVTMAHASEAAAAIQMLNGYVCNGKVLQVSLKTPSSKSSAGQTSQHANSGGERHQLASSGAGMVF